MISAARRLGGSAARRLGGSAARRLGGSAARRLGGSAARRLHEDSTERAKRGLAMARDAIPRRLVGWTVLGLLTVGVPAGVFVAARETVAANRVLALVVGLTYEGLVLGIGFAGRVARNLEDRWANRATEYVDTALRRRFSRFGANYLEHLVYRHRDFDVKGLTTRSSYTVELEQVFVDLSLVPTSPHQVSADPVSGLASLLAAGRPSALGRGGQPQRRQPIWSYLRDPSSQRLAILGAPGSGKTTLLKHVTLVLAGDERRRRELGAPGSLPILLFLREHAEAIRADPKTSLADRVRASLPELRVAEPPGWFESQLGNGRCLVLLDGLDEVADADTRRLVADWVEEQMSVHGRNAFLITSRPFGYLSNPLGAATVVEVRPFTTTQVQRFVANWYLATQIRSAGKDDEGVHMAADEGAKDLLRRLRGSPPLSALAVNPLLLTMIANVHYFRSVLPGRRVELYDEICEVFLGKRQAARGLDSDLTPAQKQLVLQTLGHHLMLKRLRDIPADEASTVVADTLMRVSPDIRPERFLKLVEETSGLLLEGESGIYRFAHLTFQEYLTAAHVREHGLVGELVRRVDEPWWHETIRLYAAKSDATPVIAACLDNGSVAALTLAAECLDEAREVQPATRSRLEAVLAEEIEGGDPDRRRVLTQVRLALRLRQMTRLREDTYVDASLVSNNEYQLFLNESYAHGAQHQPHHWRGLLYPSGEGAAPALGMRGPDAVAFCDWLTSQDPGDWRYRLPSQEELEDPANQERFGKAAQGRALWVLMGQAVGVGRVPGFEEPHDVLAARGEVLRRQVYQDAFWALARTGPGDLGFTIEVRGAVPRRLRSWVDRIKDEYGKLALDAEEYAIRSDPEEGHGLAGDILLPANRAVLGAFALATRIREAIGEPEQELLSTIDIVSREEPTVRARISDAHQIVHGLIPSGLGLFERLEPLSPFDEAIWHAFLRHGTRREQLGSVPLALPGIIDRISAAEGTPMRGPANPKSARAELLTLAYWFCFFPAGPSEGFLAVACDLYASLVLSQARADGRLPPEGGIVLLRERAGERGVLA
jgi:energy-coupling factor transporter ATP-binding protein EcfA2